MLLNDTANYMNIVRLVQKNKTISACLTVCILAVVLCGCGFFRADKAARDLGRKTLKGPVLSEKDYQELLAGTESRYGSGHPEVAVVLNGFARFHYERGNYEQARELYDRALSIDMQTMGPEHTVVARDLANLAGTVFALGEYPEAKSLYEHALANYEKNGGVGHAVRKATLLNNLAEVLHALGDYDGAETLYVRALNSSEQVHGPNHPETATVLSNVARFYKVVGNYAAARRMYDRALSITGKAYGPDHPETATVLNNRAGLYYAVNEFLEAEKLYKRALSIDEAEYGANHWLVAVRLNNLGEVRFAQGDYGQARVLYERALVIAQETRLPELLWRVQFNLAFVLNRQGNRQAAVFFGKAAVNTIQQLRFEIRSLERHFQSSFMKTKMHVYRFLADVLIDLGRFPEAQQVLRMQKEEEYFDFLRRTAAHSDVRSTMAGYSEAEHSWVQRYRTLYEKIAGLAGKSRLLEAILPQDRTAQEVKRYRQLEKELKVARKTARRYLDEHIEEFDSADGKQLAQASPESRDTQPQWQRTLRDLGHGAVIIHYVLTDEKLRILLTTADRQLCRDVTVSARDLKRKIVDYRTVLQDPRSTHLQKAAELYRIVLGPIAGDLKQAGAETLMLSLDGPLRYLPVAALHDGERYVVERYQLAVYTAAAGMRDMAAPGTQWRVGGFGLSKAVREFDPLPHVPQELEGIIRRDREDPDGVLPGVIYLDELFSEGSLKEVLAASFPAVHIAGHFKLNPGTHRQSYLVLGDGSRLPLSRLMGGGYDFGGVELMALSACNTAVGGAEANGSEIECFGTLSQDLGAEGVMATLLPVADQSTGILMQDFYRLHSEQPGRTKAEALRLAQMNLINGRFDYSERQPAMRGMQIERIEEQAGMESTGTDPAKPYAHPFFWSPFILMGNWL